MKSFILILHIVVTISLIALILLQSSKGGLGSAFGANQFYGTKRGAEKVVFMATIITAFLFLLISILNLIIQ